MRTLLLISFISLICTGCKSTGNSVSFISESINHPLYFDEAFEGFENIPIELEDDVFALDDEMKNMVRTKIVPIKNTRKRAIKLLEQIFEAESIALKYDGQANLTAIETYHSKQANCISLTIMAYALAKEANFEVNFQDVDVPEYWQRDGEYNMLTGHVNLVIKKERSSKVIWFGENILEVDFDPFVAKKSFSKRIVTKKTALAMFYNNKGAQALANGERLQAYRYIKAATESDPTFSSAWGNLGILYKQQGQESYAEAAYQKAILEDSDNNTAMNNYALLLRKQGKYDKAERVEYTVLKKRINNPYYYALLADEAMYRGDYIHALSHYRKAIKLDNSIDELYVGLANVYYQQNNIKAAKVAIRKAISLNKSKKVGDQYIAKLDMLKSKESTHQIF